MAFKSRGHPIFPLSWHTDTHAQFFSKYSLCCCCAAAIFLFKDLQFGQQSPTIQTKFRRLDSHILLFSMGFFFKNFLVAKKSLVTFDDFMENGKGQAVSRQGSSARERATALPHHLFIYFFESISRPHLINQGQLSSNFFFSFSSLLKRHNWSTLSLLLLCCRSNIRSCAVLCTAPVYSHQNDLD